MNIRTDIDPKSFPEIEKRDAKALNEEIKASAKHAHQEGKADDKSGKEHKDEEIKKN